MQSARRGTETGGTQLQSAQSAGTSFFWFVLRLSKLKQCIKKKKKNNSHEGAVAMEKLSGNSLKGAGTRTLARVGLGEKGGTVWWGRDGADQCMGPCWWGLRKERLLDFTPRGDHGWP